MRETGRTIRPTSPGAILAGDTTGTADIDPLKEISRRGELIAELEQDLIFLEIQNNGLVALIKEASDYLDTNELTSIGSTSILHQKFKAAISD